MGKHFDMEQAMELVLVLGRSKETKSLLESLDDGLFLVSLVFDDKGFTLTGKWQAYGNLSVFEMWFELVLD